MYAIIETGGKQYRVELGTELEVDRLPSEPGHEIVLDRVLLVADGDSAAVGRPLVEGAEVRANVVRQDRGEKIVVFKYRPKARHRTKRGHRQELTVLRIADIVHDGRSAAKAAAAEAKESEAAREATEREAAAQAARDRALAGELARKAGEAKARSAAETSARRGRAARGRATAEDSKAESPKTAGKQDAGAKAGAKTEAKTRAKAPTTKEPPAPKAKPTSRAAAEKKPAQKASASTTRSSTRAEKPAADGGARKADNTKARRGRATKED